MICCENVVDIEPLRKKMAVVYPRVWEYLSVDRVKKKKKKTRRRRKKRSKFRQ